jgi:general secretion pathway protein C
VKRVRRATGKHMDALLRKYFWVAIGALLALAAYFQAAGATALAGSAMEPKTSLLASAPPPLVPAPKPPVPKSGQPILARNPFDSVTGPLLTKPADDASTAPPAVTDPLNAPPCQGVEVHGTTQANNPRWSLAIVQGPGEEHGLLRRIGDEVANKEIVYIGFNPRKYSPAVWLHDDSGLCQSLLFTKKATTPSATPKPNPPAHHRGRPHRGARKLPNMIAAKIQRLGPTEFNVDRSAVDTILSEHTSLMRGVRVMPVERKGKVLGVRVFNVQPDTLLGTLGLKNGDRIDSINGFPLSNPEKALQAYARLRTASNITVNISRGGKPQSIEFHIR